jgi:hypothetical protein
MAWDHVAVEGNAPDHRNGKSAAKLILAQEKIFGARKDYLPSPFAVVARSSGRRSIMASGLAGRAGSGDDQGRYLRECSELLLVAGEAGFC